MLAERSILSHCNKAIIDIQLSWLVSGFSVGADQGYEIKALKPLTLLAWIKPIIHNLDYIISSDTQMSLDEEAKI